MTSAAMDVLKAYCGQLAEELRTLDMHLFPGFGKGHASLDLDLAATMVLPRLRRLVADAKPQRLGDVLAQAFDSTSFESEIDPFFPVASADALVFFDRSGMLLGSGSPQADESSIHRLVRHVLGVPRPRPQKHVRAMIMAVLDSAARLERAADWLWHYQRALVAGVDLNTLEHLAKAVARQWRWVATSRPARLALENLAKAQDLEPALVEVLRAAVVRELLPVLTLQRALLRPLSAQQVLRRFKLPGDLEPAVVELFAQCLPFLGNGPEEPCGFAFDTVVRAINPDTSSEDMRQFLVSQCVLAMELWVENQRAQGRSTAPLHERYQPLVDIAARIGSLDLCRFRSSCITSAIRRAAPTNEAAMATHGVSTLYSLAHRLATARALWPGNPALAHCLREIYQPALTQLNERIADRSSQFAPEVLEAIERANALLAGKLDPSIELLDELRRHAEHVAFLPRVWDESRGERLSAALSRVHGEPARSDYLGGQFIRRMWPGGHTLARIEATAGAIVLLTGLVAAGARELQARQFANHYQPMLVAFEEAMDAELLDHAQAVLASAPPDATAHRDQASRLRDAALVRLFVAHLERGDEAAAARLIEQNPELEEAR